ncbi:30S ribosomal protein S2 [Patescibacteria group bacterium]
MAKIKIDLKKMIEAGAHYGHQTKRWNPKMAPYMHGSEDGTHIFDLIQTRDLLEEALDVITKTSNQGKAILLLGTKKQAQEMIEKVGQETGIFYVSERWLGGTYTNFSQIQKSLRKLADMKKDREEGKYKILTKKERLLIDREIERLERFFGGISTMDDMPDLMIVVDIKREKSAVIEARMKGVRTIGIVDSNSDPDDVDHPIPMNDDATSALDYVLGLIRDAILEGKKKVKAKPKAKKAVKKTAKSSKAKPKKTKK